MLKINKNNKKIVCKGQISWRRYYPYVNCTKFIFKLCPELMRECKFTVGWNSRYSIDDFICIQGELGKKLYVFKNMANDLNIGLNLACFMAFIQEITLESMMVLEIIEVMGIRIEPNLDRIVPNEELMTQLYKIAYNNYEFYISEFSNFITKFRDENEHINREFILDELKTLMEELNEKDINEIDIFTKDQDYFSINIPSLKNNTINFLIKFLDVPDYLEDSYFMELNKRYQKSDNLKTYFQATTENLFRSAYNKTLRTCLVEKVKLICRISGCNVDCGNLINHDDCEDYT